MSRLIPSYIEQALRIETLERAMIASEQDYERMKAAAQAAYRAMVAMELSDGSKREWEAAVDGLKAALAEQKPMLEMNPEKRPWVGLTDEDWATVKSMQLSYIDQGVACAAAILKEKNGG